MVVFSDDDVLSHVLMLRETDLRTVVCRREAEKKRVSVHNAVLGDVWGQYLHSVLVLRIGKDQSY